jgi:hypothetical protein
MARIEGPRSLFELTIMRGVFQESALSAQRMTLKKVRGLLRNKDFQLEDCNCKFMSMSMSCRDG